MARAEMSSDQIARLIAKEYGVAPEALSYQWQIEDWEFKGVILFDMPRKAESTNP